MMLNKIKKIKKGLYKQKVGKPPGSLVYLGDADVPVSIIYCEFSESTFEKKTVAEFDELKSLLNDSSDTAVRWINVLGVNDVQLINNIGEHFGIHKLVLEDILNVHMRPKFEDFKDYIFLALKSIVANDSSLIQDNHVGILKKGNTVITFQDNSQDIFTDIYPRIYDGNKVVFRLESDYLFYAVTDLLVDHYYSASENLQDKSEEFLEKLLEAPEEADMRNIQEIMKVTHRMRQLISPLKEILHSFSRYENTLIKSDYILYFRDTYDHQLQIIDTLESVRDSITNMLNLHLTGLSNKMNEVMKVLTIIATIFIPLTFIAGVYGMNFHYMPEIELKYGYFIILGIMLVVGLLLLMYFRKKDWL